ncbi:MAG: M20/M25/M40 family metallo-hydrolase [Anaerolineae bacterium]
MDLRLLLSLRKLVYLPGISGLEDTVGHYMAEYFEAHADEVRIDAIGNVIARYGPPTSDAIAILAHMDTVGMLVKRHNSDGSLGIVPIGGINLKSLPGTSVLVGDELGIIGVRSQHQARDGDELTQADDIYVNVRNAHMVEITTPIYYATQPVEMGELFASPYLDNRTGCAVLLHLAEQLQSAGHTVYLIGTVQEETTSAGAYSVLNTIKPTCAVFVDGTVTYDTPESRGRGSVMLGNGPVLTAFLYTSGSNGWHADPQLYAHLKKLASDNDIPYQQDATHGLISDAKVATWLGLPSAIIGIPMRGKHSQLEVVHIDDLEQTIALLTAFVRQPLPTLQRGK